MGAVEEDKDTVRKYGHVLGFLDATEFVYDSVMKLPYSIDIGNSNGDRASGKFGVDRLEGCA